MSADEAVVRDERSVVDIQEMNLRFLYREPLTLKASREEALLSGPSSRIQVQSSTYGFKKPAPSAFELPAWSVPADVALQVRDDRSCALLHDPDVFLPVETESPFRCDMVMDASGRAVVWLVGIGRPFQDVPFLQSMLLVLDDKRYHMLSYIEPFPEADATAQWLHDMFEERHPHMSKLVWPNKSFLLLVGEIRQALAQQIDPPSAEVDDAMAALRTMAFSVGPSQEAMGQ